MFFGVLIDPLYANKILPVIIYLCSVNCLYESFISTPE